MRVVLHVGLPKAASTSIQVWLRTHRQDLLAHGVYVPTSGHRADRHSPGGRTHAHDVLARMMHWPWALGLWLDRYLREAGAAGATTLVLSAENLTHPANVADLPRFAAAFRRQIARRPAASLEVLVITRDAETWLHSYYSEAVLNGRSFETRSFERFRAGMAARGLSPDTLADLTEQCFPGQVHRIGLGDVAGAGLFHRLSALLRVPDMETAVGRHRVSPTAGEIEAQRRRNAELRARPWRVGANPRALARVLLASVPERPYLAIRRNVRAVSSFVAVALLARRG